MDQVKKAKRKLAEGKTNLEVALREAAGPGSYELEDLYGLNRHALVDKIAVMDKSLVGAASHGFDNAVKQLKVVNPEEELCVEGIYFLKFVENGVLVSPPEEEVLPPTVVA